MTIDEVRFRQLTTTFLKVNESINLSAFRSPELCWVGNVQDSLSLVKASESIPELQQITRLCDIGTGGGFPLLPLALAWSSVSCTGIDSTTKKLTAIQQIIDQEGLNNVRLVSGRLEELGHDSALRGTFDLVTARALATLPVLLEYAAPLLRIGGILACYKSTKVADELSSTVHAQKLLHMPYLRTWMYNLGEHWGERTIVFFQKKAETPEEYPRANGIPKQKPL